MSEGAIAGTIITATEATTSDAIVVAYEGTGEGELILYSGPATPFGGRVAKLVRLGVKEALKAHYGSNAPFSNAAADNYLTRSAIRNAETCTLFSSREYNLQEARVLLLI